MEMVGHFICQRRDLEWVTSPGIESRGMRKGCYCTWGVQSSKNLGSIRGPRDTVYCSRKIEFNARARGYEMDSERGVLYLEGTL